MLLLYTLLGLFFLLIICFLLIPMPAETEYLWAAGENVFKVKVWGVKIYTGNKKDKADESEPQAYKKDKSDKDAKMGFSEFMGGLSAFKKITKDMDDDINRLLKYLKNKLSCKMLTFKLDVGFEDAALTGIAAGAAYALVYGLASVVYNTVGIHKMDINVNPVFGKACVNVYAKSIFTIAPVHIIRILCMVLSIRGKIKNAAGKAA